MVHIGCATLHNFDIMVARRSSYGLIFDFNPENKTLMDDVIAIIYHMSTRQQFLDYMEKYLPVSPVHFISKSKSSRNAAEYFLIDSQQETLTPFQELSINATRPDSWLYTEATYQYIRSRVLQDQIITLVQDITHTDIFTAIASWIRSYGAVIDTIYLSNINIFMSTHAMQSAFVRTVYSLISPTTLVIICPQKSIPSYPGEDISNPLDQHILTGAMIMTNPAILFRI
jgi:hypothetical protein